MFRHIRNVKGFFSDYYLGSIFGRGEGRSRKKQLSDRDTDAAYNRFRRLYQRVEGQVLDSHNTRERFVRPLLRDVLGFHLGSGEESVYPLFKNAEEEQAGHSPILLAYCGASDEELDKGHGNSTPMKRLEKTLADGIEHGFLITSERFRMVRAPGEGPSGAYLEVDLPGLASDEDPESFAAFYRLFYLSNFLPDENGKISIHEVERLSREHAERVSEDLKRSVFRATEILVSGLLKDAVHRGDILDLLKMSDLDLRLFRDAGLTALYRILFILYAEARDTRLDSHQVYRDAYSVHGLVEEILRQPSQKWPENRTAYWERLLALFSIYDKGLPAITPWENIPPRGGDFFNAKTPAGLLLEKACLSDALVAELLLALTTTVPRLGVGRERVSFRELDIESLGAVYEGLLEYEPRVAYETNIEVRVQGKVFALPPTEVVRLCAEKNLKVSGELAIVAGTEAESLHPDAAIEEEETESEEIENEESERGDGESGEDEAEDKGVKKGSTAKLLRRLEPGDFHFVPGSARKGSGSFYTPTELVKDLINHTLGPLAKGKSSEEILRLRVLDPACGSAHFLVEAMRFLGKELHRALVQEHGGKAPAGFQRGEWDANFEASDEEARAANSEARAWCKRQIAEHCLFGVDLNPTAVSLARVALWIESLAGDRPLSYFEHHIRCGNSLLGTWLARLDQPPLPTMSKVEIKNQSHLFGEIVRKAVHEAAGIRRMIDEAKPDSLQQEGIDPETIQEQEFKEVQRQRADQLLQAAHLLFDLRSASAFLPEIWHDWASLCGHVENLNKLTEYAHSCSWWSRFEEIRNRERFFHWELEFPEVFFDSQHSGFDAVLGNPPWDKIKPDKKEFYGKYDILIRAFVGGELDRRISELESGIPNLGVEFSRYENRVKTLAACLKKGGDYQYQDWEIDGKSTGGDPDVFKFFLEQGCKIAHAGGFVGFVVPSALYNNEGCTGLRHLLLEEADVKRFYAFENRRKVFPIDSRYKFISLVFAKQKSNQNGFEAAFMRHDLGELAEDNPKSWMVWVKRTELERLSPGTLAFLEYRSPRDREILLKMYGYDANGDPVNPRPLLGDRGPGTWNAKFYREFDMTNDKDLWTDPKTSKLWTVKQILGFEPSDFEETRSRMAEKGFWPLYEGKHIHQFLANIKPIERWVNLEVVLSRYGRPPISSPKVVVRAIARNTDERTCIAAVIPEKSCFGNSLYGCITTVDPVVVVTILNSFSADYALRLRMSSNVSPVYLRTTATVVELHPSFLELSLSMPPGTIHVSQVAEFWPAIWELNRTVAEAYGLNPSDFEHILNSFPVFARKRPEFHAYLRERLAEWKAEAGSPAKVIPMYPLPPRATASPAAESPASYGKVSVSSKPGKKHVASEQFRQAAILAWVVDQLFTSGHPVSRYRAGKIIYLIERAMELGLFKNYLKQAAGPYDPSLRYHGPEDIAIRQHRWLTAADASHFQPGPNIGEVSNYVKSYLDTVQASAVIEEFRTYQDPTLSRWTTVDFAARELQSVGKPVNTNTVLDYLRATPEWTPKTEKKEFEPDRISNTLSGLQKLGFLQ